MKRRFVYEFDTASPRTIRLDYSDSESEILKVEAADGSVRLFVNKGAASVLAKLFAQLAVGDLANGAHIHLREDLDAQKGEVLTVLLDVGAHG